MDTVKYVTKDLPANSFNDISFIIDDSLKFPTTKSSCIRYFSTLNTNVVVAPKTQYIELIIEYA